MKSPSLQTKLNRALSDTVVEEITQMLEITTSVSRFDSAAELKMHLCEGALLNINRIASQALSIPCGQYMVWATNAGQTMLVPIKLKSDEVFETTSRGFEIHTPSLIAAYNQLERVLSEDEDLPPEFLEKQAEERKEAEPQGTREGQFRSRVDPGDIDRHPLLRAMQQRGMSVTELASAVGVDPPCISRLLRTSGDSARNPSIGNASEIANVLRTDVEALFPDIFSGERKEMKPRQTTGSHGGGKGGVSSKRMKARQKWTQGNK